MNVNMGGMNTMGGPVGGGMPTMNNGARGAVRQSMPVNDNQRSQLNTYIYEYFLKNGMYDCARSLLSSEQPINIMKDSPGRENGNDEGGENDNKDGLDSKRPDDLPAPHLPKECPESCFLYEWWCLFWDMFNAQRGKGDLRSGVNQYVAHTQAQSRMRQEQQQAMLRTMRPDLMPGQYNSMMMRNQVNGGMNLNNNEIARKAMQNNSRNATPQQMQMLQQQQQKQQQMQRGPSDGEHPRPQSPGGSAENAPSPSKRARLDGAPFNPQGMMPNGRGQAGIPGQQFPNFQGGANPQKIAAYQANLSQQQQKQMPNQNMPNAGAPQNQGPPSMMLQGQDGSTIHGYYNVGEVGPNTMRGGPGGQPGSGGNHALQDYQMQLMLLEQQNKKRLMMARQEQEGLQPRPDGQGGPPGPGALGPNGQPFQGASPQGARNSPNPSEQMKRGTPHMNHTGIPSPLPEGQNRGSPGAMNFNMAGGQMDPNMAPQFYKMNGMEGSMPGPNGMRPPSSHPAGNFNNGQMTPQQQQQLMAARQQQAQQQQQQQQPGWQGRPNGAQMMPNQSQGAPQQAMGTPQQRAMPPPSAPATGAAPNGRTQPSSPQQNAAPPTPQQASKANPKKKNEGKDNKPKRPTKKGSTTALTGAARPSAESAQEPATPTPATPITPQHAKSFSGQNGAVQPVANGQPAAVNNTGVASSQQPDPMGGFGMDGASGFDIENFQFAPPGNAGMDVLQDFDFDSFLHQDTEGVDNFGFDTGFLDTGEMAAE